MAKGWIIPGKGMEKVWRVDGLTRKDGAIKSAWLFKHKAGKSDRLF